MSKTLYKVWCEYDLGLDGQVFPTEEAAMAAGRKAAKDCALSNQEIKELIEGNLLYAEPLTFIQD